MSMHYGYLQGTFGMPYGGYCVRPPQLRDIELSAQNEHLRMFCIVGTFCEAMEWLEANDLMVSNLCTEQATFTHDLVAEVYSSASYLEQLFRGRNGINVQLVIRIARSWDRRRSGEASTQFKPMLKAIVPSGISLPEIRDVLYRATPGTAFDATHDKPLLNEVLTRVSTRGTTRAPSPEIRRLLHDPLALPSYVHSAERPPRYSSLEE